MLKLPKAIIAKTLTEHTRNNELPSGTARSGSNLNVNGMPTKHPEAFDCPRTDSRMPSMASKGNSMRRILKSLLGMCAVSVIACSSTAMALNIIPVILGMVEGMLTNLLHLMFGGGDTTNIVELTAFRIVAIIAIPVGIAGALASSVAAGLGGAVGAAWTSTHRYAARLFGTLGIAAGIWISRTCLDYTIDKYNSGQTGDSTGLFTSLHFQAYCGPSVLGWIGSIVIFAVGFAILWKSTIPSLNPSQSDSSKPDGNISTTSASPDSFRMTTSR